MLTADLNHARRIGCEFEMTVPLVGSGGGTEVQETIARVLNSNGLRAMARGYSHEPIPAGQDFAVEYDSSVSGESRFDGINWHSVELKTRILNGIADWQELVPKALTICRYMGARVNRSTAHHLHIEFPEARDNPTKIRSLFNMFHRFEPVIYGLLPPSRKNNGYARAIAADRSRSLHGCRSWRCFEQALTRWDRHCGLNLIHLFDRNGPRIELRYHGGTLDPEKARHWLRFCLQMVQHACNRNCQATREQTTNDRNGLENLLMSCGFKVNSGIYQKVCPELRETGKYLIKRWKHFNGKIALRPKVSGQVADPLSESETN